MTFSPATPVDGTANSASFDWNFNSGSEAFNYLQDGDTLILTYTVTATDSSNGTDTDTVTITITGTNDDPVISVESGDSDAETIAETNAGLTEAGTLTVTDSDTRDTVAVSVESLAVTGDDNGLGNAALLALLSVDLIDVVDGTANTGKLNWSFNSGTEAFDHLAASEAWYWNTPCVRQTTKVERMIRRSLLRLQGRMTLLILPWEQRILQPKL